MSIRLGRSICGHLATAESREWLITNGIGGYGCGTIAGHLTRHYHGLLVATLDPPLGRTLLLAKLEETVQYEGRDERDRGNNGIHKRFGGERAIPLFTNRWSDGTVSPHGYRQIESFQLDGAIPLWKFAIGDALLCKRVWMQQGENTTYTSYALRRGSGPLTLSIKVVVNYRDHHGGTSELEWHIESVPNGITAKAFTNAVPFYVFANGGTVTVQQSRFDRVNLSVEEYRGTGDRDSYWQVATISSTLMPGDMFTVVASTNPSPNMDGAVALSDRRAYEESLLAKWELADTRRHHHVPAWIEQLVLAADQFIVDRSIPNPPLNSPTFSEQATPTLRGETGGKSVIAGYPWFSDWGRDTMISLPGLAIATGRPELARPILQVFGQYLDQGMLPNMFPESGQTPHYNTVDATLWYFEAIRSYVHATQEQTLLAELFPALAEVIQWHCRGTRHNIHLDAVDGLLYAGEDGVQLTWMDAKVGDWVVTPRIGKPVEINALWYNALVCMTHFAQSLGHPHDEYQRLAERCATGFQRFWNPELGYCFDVLDTPNGGHESALRPNQLFAVALPYDANHNGSTTAPLLTAVHQKAVVDSVARELVTSYGVRSLLPQHPDYGGHYGGDQRQRDATYHQGTVWSWLIGPFIHSHLRVYNNPTQAHEWLESMADHLTDAGVGTISEIFDGDAPFTPRGCFAQAWGVAEVLRAWVAIESYGGS
ncbi:MAG: amylo-alpha-1,6-glucosidase [Cyanobacteria bacterium P01_F01_bin.150]